jgi:hypothetical protein
VITDYRVQNVLRIYSRRLEEAKTMGSAEDRRRSNETRDRSETEVVNISKDARRFLIERIKSQALAAHQE